MIDSGIQKTRNRGARLILLAVTGCLALVAIYYPVRDYCLNRQAASWKSVPARVEAMQALHTVNFKDPYFSVSISYRYVVDGKEYIGNRLAFGGLDPMLGYDLGVFIRSHEIGKDAGVMVEPGNPASSILESSVQSSLPILLGRCLALTMFISLIYLGAFPVISGDKEEYESAIIS